MTQPDAAGGRHEDEAAAADAKTSGEGKQKGEGFLTWLGWVGVRARRERGVWGGEGRGGEARGRQEASLKTHIL